MKEKNDKEFDQPAATAVAATLIIVERNRQIAVEGYSHEHDDIHRDGELGFAAACYAAPKAIFTTRRSAMVDAWPWDAVEFKRGWNEKYQLEAIQARIRDLAKAGALVLAEIERLQRAQKALDTKEAK